MRGLAMLAALASTVVSFTESEPARPTPPIPSRILRPAPQECPTGIVRAPRIPIRNLIDQMGGYVPRWLPDGFGLAHAFGSGDGFEGQGIWSDAQCRQVQVYYFTNQLGGGRPEGPTVDEWVVLYNAPNQCSNAVLGRARCLGYRVRVDGAGLGVQMMELDRYEADRIIQSIPINASSKG
jgi:hypothetical protein